MTILHTFASTMADGADATLVRPSNWNADHTLTNLIASADAASDVGSSGTRWRDLWMSGSLKVLSSASTGNLTNAVLTTARTWTLPDAGGTVSLGTGTANTVTKWTGASVLGNSLLTDDGTNVTLGSGRLFISTGTAVAPSLTFVAAGNNNGFHYSVQGNGVSMSVNGENVFACDNSPQCTVASLARISWGNTNNADAGTFDIALWRDAAAILAQRNGTNAQEHRLYGTFTDSANYERLDFLTQAANSNIIASQAAGTGTVRELILGQTGAPSRLRTSELTPATPALVNGDWWVECSGVSPNRNCSIKVQEAGATRNIATSANF